jgi:hypothetical protein
MSQAVMPKLKNFVRGAGRVVQSNGLCGGGAAKVLRFEVSHPHLDDNDRRNALFSAVMAMDRVLAIRLFEVDAEATTIQTEEKKIRTSKEEIYSQLLVIEAADSDAFAPVTEKLEAALFRDGTQPRPFDQSYQLIAELQKRSLS